MRTVVHCLTSGGWSRFGTASIAPHQCYTTSTSLQKNWLRDPDKYEIILKS
jgi:hypothetical protein